MAVILATANSTAFAQPQGQQGIRSKEGKAPDRDGNGQTDGYEQGCPPVQDNFPAPGSQTKAAHVAADKDVNNDGRTDFFMGEWEFIKGNKDLKVRMWCINKAESAGGWGDYFTFEVLTSENGVDTPAVAPNFAPPPSQWPESPYPASLPRAGAT